MKIKVYVIDFSLPRWFKRTSALALPPLVLLLGLGSTVNAAPPPSFAAGEVLSASKLNQSFADLGGRLAKVESRVTGGGTYSTGAVFCKATLGSSGGDLKGFGAKEGYAATHDICQATCNNSPTAHLCSTEEVIRTAASGKTMPAGWFASASYPDDCTSFTTTSGSAMAWRTTPEPARAANTACSTSLPLLCCDAP